MRKFLVVLVLVPVAYAQAQIRFENVAEEAGIDDPGINGAGVAFWDYDQDGDVDVYITNSDSGTMHLGLQNRLWENDGTGKFRDVSTTTGMPTW
jgi:hypothetical protein